MTTQEKVVLSADEFTRDALLGFVKDFGSQFYAIKIHSLYDELGPQIVSELKNAGARRVWVDAKLHDIPNTVRLRAKAFASVGCDILTVHASGGEAMLQAAKEGFGSGMVLAVTILTSLDEFTVKKIYQTSNINQLVSNLAIIAKISGVDGVVCSAKEVGMLRANKDNLKLVVPGIRSAGEEVHDQSRFDTPKNALEAGADLLVIGRQLTQALDPKKALELLQNEII